jgi:hypothetical protein
MISYEAGFGGRKMEEKNGAEKNGAKKWLAFEKQNKTTLSKQLQGNDAMLYKKKFINFRKKNSSIFAKKWRKNLAFLIRTKLTYAKI